VNRFNYMFKRLLVTIPVLFVVTLLIFFMIRLIPGDPARITLGEMAIEEDIIKLREEMGLNESYFVQYTIFMNKLVHFDLGKSLVYKRPVAELIKSKIIVTISLTLVATIFAIIISFPMGYLAGTHKDKLPDQIIRVLSLASISVPAFWVGLMLMLIFGVRLKLLPAGGWGRNFFDCLRSLILPGIAQALVTTALMMRNLRNSVVDINKLDYVDFARSKGANENIIRKDYIMRNAMISTITLLGMRMTWMLGGSIIIETVFSLPGLGKFMIDSIFGRDYASVQSLVFIFSFLVLIMNLLTDVIYSIIDPRVTLE